MRIDYVRQTVVISECIIVLRPHLGTLVEREYIVDDVR